MQTITTIAISERETPENAANNAVSAINNHYLPHTEYHTASVATHPSNDDLLLSSHIKTEPGSKLVAEALEQTQTNITNYITELKTTLNNTPTAELFDNTDFFLDCAQLGNRQSKLYTLIDTTGYNIGRGLRSSDAIDYILEHTPEPVYAVKIQIK